MAAKQEEPQQAAEEMTHLKMQRMNIGKVLELCHELEEEQMSPSPPPEMPRSETSLGTPRRAQSQKRSFSDKERESDPEDPEELARGESPIEEVQEEAAIDQIPSLMGPSSTVLLAMPLGHPTSKDVSGQLAAGRETAEPQAAATANSQPQQHPVQHGGEGGTEGDADTKTTINGFLRQFQGALPPKGAADCVVCALRPVQQPGCGDSCSCCSETKKAAVLRLQHQLAVIVPSPGTTSQDLLYQQSEQPVLAHLLNPSNNSTATYAERLVAAEEEKKGLEQKLCQVLQQQQILQREVAFTTTQFQAQQATWEQKDRLQQDQILFLSAKLKAYSEELEALRNLRLLNPPINHELQMLQQEQQQQWRQGSQQRPEAKRHVSSRPRSCTSCPEDMRKQGAASTFIGTFRPRSKTEDQGGSIQGQREKLLGFAERQQGDCKGCVRSDMLCDSLQPWQQLGQRQQEQRVKEEELFPANSMQQERRRPNPRQRAQTTASSPQQLPVFLKPLRGKVLAVRQQKENEGSHFFYSTAKLDGAAGRARSALLRYPLAQESSASPPADGGEKGPLPSSSPGHMVEGQRQPQQEHLLRWEETEAVWGRDNVLLDACEERDSSLSSLQIEFEEPDDWSSKRSLVSRAQRLQSSFLPAPPKRSHMGSEGGKPQMRSTTQIPQRLNLQLESLRHQLLVNNTGGPTKGLSRQQRGTEKTVARDASARRQEGQMQHENQPMQKRQKEAWLPRAARVTSVQSLAAATPTPRDRSLTTVPMQQDTGSPAMAVPVMRWSGKGPSHKGVTNDPKSHSAPSDSTADKGNAEQQQLQEEGRQSFECLYLSSKLSQEDRSHVRIQETSTPQEEKRQEQRLEKTGSKRKVVHWLARSRSCSFAAERALNHRLLYLMPRGETLHPRKLQQLIRGDELLQEEMQLMTQQEGDPPQRFDEDKQQQPGLPGTPTNQPAAKAGEQHGTANSASGETQANGELQKRGNGADDEKAIQENATAQADPCTRAGGTDSKPPTPAFPQVAEVEAASLHVECACEGAQEAGKPEGQQIQQWQEQQQQVASHQSSEPCSLQTPAGQPPPPGLHSPVQSVLSQQQQQAQHQQQALPWLAASEGHRGGFIAAPTQLPQAVLGGYASCPLALQPLAPVSPRPVLVVYTSACIQQQQQQQPQEESTLAGTCRSLSCCQGGTNRTPPQDIWTSGTSSLCSNGASGFCEAGKRPSGGAAASERGVAGDYLPARCSNSSDDRTSDSSGTESWCLLCESADQPAAQPVPSQGERKGACTPCTSGQVDPNSSAPEKGMERDNKDVKEPTGSCKPCSQTPITTSVKEHPSPRKASQPSVTSPRKLLPPQPTPDADTGTSPPPAGTAKPPSEAAGEAPGASTTSRGSPRGRSKTTCLKGTARLPIPRAEAGSMHTRKPVVQVPVHDRQEGSQKPNQPQPQQDHHEQSQPLLAAVATQTSLTVSHGGAPRLVTGPFWGLRGSLSALHSQPVLHQEGVDYLNPAPGDNASISSASSFSSLGTACSASASIQLPMQQKPQQQQQALATVRTMPTSPYCAKPGPVLNHQAGAHGQRPAHRSDPVTPIRKPRTKSLCHFKKPPSEAVRIVESHSDGIAMGTATHEHLKKQILQLQHWQTQLHRQQHAQHQRLIQQQKLFQQQQRLFQKQQQHQRQQQRQQLHPVTGFHQQSATPQVKPQYHLHFPSMPVPYVEMGPPSGSLLFLQVQESPRWLPGGPLTQQDVTYRMPTSMATATPARPAMATPVQMQRRCVDTLASNVIVAKRDRPATATSPAAETLPTPIPPILKATSGMFLQTPRPAVPPAASQTAGPPSYASHRMPGAHPPTTMSFQPWDSGL